MSSLIQEAIERIIRHCKTVDGCFECELRDHSGDGCYLTRYQPHEWNLNDVPERMFK